MKKDYAKYGKFSKHVNPADGIFMCPECNSSNMKTHSHDDMFCEDCGFTGRVKKKVLKKLKKKAKENSDEEVCILADNKVYCTKKQDLEE